MSTLLDAQDELTRARALVRLIGMSTDYCPPTDANSAALAAGCEAVLLRLDAELDALLVPNRPLWGLAKIADYLGLSADTVRELAAGDATPIYRPAGRYFAWSQELDAWLRTK